MHKFTSWILALGILVLGAGLSGAAAPAAVTLDAQEGSLEDGLSVMELDLAEATQLPTPSRAGHGFGGWFSQPDGGGEALQLPINPEQGALRYFARWVPLRDCDAFTVRIIWADSSTTSPQPASYCYRFLEEHSGAQIDLNISPQKDLDAQAQVATYQAEIHLPRRAPDGSPAVYGTVAEAGYGLVWQDGIAYTSSYREALRPDAGSQAAYFHRERLLRRMIHPWISIRWEGTSPEDLTLSLSAQPADAGAAASKASAVAAADGNLLQQVSLFDLFEQDRGSLLDFAWDELDHQLRYLGHNQFALSASAPEGCTAAVTGDVFQGFAVTITGP